MIQYPRQHSTPAPLAGVTMAPHVLMSPSLLSGNHSVRFANRQPPPKLGWQPLPQQAAEKACVRARITSLIADGRGESPLLCVALVGGHFPRDVRRAEGWSRAHVPTGTARVGWNCARPQPVAARVFRLGCAQRAQRPTGRAAGDVRVRDAIGKPLARSIRAACAGRRAEPRGCAAGADRVARCEHRVGFAADVKRSERREITTFPFACPSSR